MTFFRSLFILSLSLYLISCGPKTEKDIEIPVGILAKDKFAKVLTDFALAESAANMNIKNVVVQKTDSVYAFDPLLENNVRQSQYDSTVRFYTSEPELYKKVYEKVLENMSEMQAQRNGIKVDSTSK